MHGVREHVHLGVGPVDELAVHPDLLGRGNGHAQSLSAMASPTAVVDSCADGVCRHGVGLLRERLEDSLRGVVLAQMLEHERGRVDGGQRVGDPLAGDVVRRAVDRLEERRARASRVEVGGGGEADAAADRAGQVGQDVPEEVVGHDDVVAARLLHQVDAGGVDVVVVPGDPGELGRDLGHRAIPQIAGEGEHVRLVHQGQRGGSVAAPPARRRSARTARHPSGCSPNPGWPPRPGSPCAGTRPHPHRSPRCSHG